MRFWQRWFNNDDTALYPQRLMESLLAMAWFVEARDPYTGGHLWRVSRYAYLLASAVKCSEADVARISLGGFLHDLGKIGVPDAILRKPDRLTDEEYAMIKTHPDIGLRMLAGHPLATLVAEAVGKHHEQPDGTGYPNGLKREQIPIDARIVGICDAFDAMTSHRPYRAGMSQQKALSILESGAGSQFDSELVAAFVQLGQRGDLQAIIAHSDDGIPLRSCPMCGPTLAIRREQVAGEHIYCRNCSGEFELAASAEHQLHAIPTGKTGSAADLEPQADTALITRTVRELVAALPLSALLKQGSRHAADGAVS
ncbi:HD-GYP domain-containing protein [Dasania marina]|uniref:HD-GYP domain-containing protein n=1 Tax=Dasania marina TaxID=471499 RepID=UPI0030D7E1C1|tara:strand:- start:90497 stop:91432 length:936 start_codon:yes stop_codon:yes gene_type:complete